MKVTLGSLRVGATFVTGLTGRNGIVLEGQRKHYGVEVSLDNPDEEKLVHQSVVVETENVH